MYAMRSIHVAALTAALLAAGCGSKGSTTGSLAAGTGAATAASTSGAGTGAGGAGTSGTGGTVNECPGQCVPVEPDGWDTPVIVWFGDLKDAPSCEDSAVGYKGYGGLQRALRLRHVHLRAAVGLVHLARDHHRQRRELRPERHIDPAHALRSVEWVGRGVRHERVHPLGQALLRRALRAVRHRRPAHGERGWLHALHAPGAEPPGVVDLHDRVPDQSLPDVHQPGEPLRPAARSGFKVCVYAYSGGDVPCPDVGPYQEKHVSYQMFEDTRGCSNCTCANPSGSSCASDVSLYTDGACSTVAASIAVDSSAPTCANVPSGSALGSKSASPPGYSPGTCAPGGGAPMGAATPVMAATYCCLPGS